MSGRCRFCRRLLRSAGSRAAGYGPRCARDRGLPQPSCMPVAAATRASGGPAQPAGPTGPPDSPQAVTPAQPRRAAPAPAHTRPPPHHHHHPDRRTPVTDQTAALDQLAGSASTLDGAT